MEAAVRSLILIPVVLVSLLGCSSEPAAPEGHGAHGHAHGGADDATVRHRFEDAERWAARFEDPERDAWQQPARVLELMELPAAGKLVDIGAATGYFPVRFARAMPEGVVYGVDLEPTLVNYLTLRAHREGLTNLIALTCTADDPCVPEPVDVAFLCDTYHHIDDRVAYFRRLQDALTPDGRLVVVDFLPGELPVGPPPGHKLSAERVTEELAQAGYERVAEHTLTHQYLLVFRPRR